MALGVPINKSIWTSSYVVFTAGMGAVTLATCMWLIDGLGLRRWTFPFVVYGTNPMLAFLGSGLMARCISSLWTWDVGTERGSRRRDSCSRLCMPRGSHRGMRRWHMPFVAVWFLILWAAWKRGFVLKV